MSTLLVSGHIDTSCDTGLHGKHTVCQYPWHVVLFLLVPSGFVPSSGGAFICAVGVCWCVTFLSHTMPESDDVDNVDQFKGACMWCAQSQLE